ncbi:hypothetical protein UFOVP131_39 [uncultured Caudovirales phage]|jgi:hypothetical protein|uniref:Putative DnaT-like domain-containing protein n=1 Tax=uncultured Caudovirales phage TaxID=2100421 RepID=A0A6J5LAV4_9CAUD|nr:hypothetical protein UFOVP131_39 [uncultured Caudovirales phage]
MALSVGNIAASSTYDSAVSVEYVDAYHEARGNAAWGLTDPTVKEQLLRKVGDYLSATYGRVWSRGLVASSTVPVALAKASAELALIAKTTPLVTNVTRGKKRVKVGPLEIEYDGNATTQTQFVMASRMLAPLLVATSGAMVKLNRC